MKNNAILKLFRLRARGQTLKVVGLLLGLLVCIPLYSSGLMTIQEVRVSIKVRNVNILDVLKKLEDNTQVGFFYKIDQLDLTKRYTLTYKGASLEAVLQEVFKDQKSTYEIVGSNIVVKERRESSKEKGAAVNEGKSFQLRGKVVDNTGSAIPGVTVSIRGVEGKGSITDADGGFVVSSLRRGDVLVFSFIGMKTTIITYGSEPFLNVAMQLEDQRLDEVVVTALGIKRSEKSLGYSVQNVSGSAVQQVKGVNVLTSLTGKVAGLQIKNSTEFNEAPTMKLRGGTPLIVVDGVPYDNISFRDISSDDIESLDILKGATAAALYGSRGQNGAVMVTLKKAAKNKGVQISVNSNTMFRAGFLKLPKVQTSYSAGSAGKLEYNSGYVWGAKMDIGTVGNQYNPITMNWEMMPIESRGKNNLSNFLESSYVTNNNVSISQQGENGSFRISLTHVGNKGQYPNTRIDNLTFNLGGTMEISKKLRVESNFSYNKRLTPNTEGTSYGGRGYLYNILIWTGTEYDLSQFRNYWKDKDKKQNWIYSGWYDNPYFSAYERIHSYNRDVVNGYISTTYNISSNVKVLLRNGVDFYNQRDVYRNSIGAYGGWNQKGYFQQDKASGLSSNNDLIVTYTKKIGKFDVDVMGGGAIYYKENDQLSGSTKNGLSIPGFYSLKSSVEQPNVSAGIWKKQVNSVYAKASLGYDNAFFLDFTARNDWSSTLPASTRSYFYPSVSGSIVLSELIKLPEAVDFWKIRTSWTVSKSDLAIYATNQAYSISLNAWDTYSAAYYPDFVKVDDVKPLTDRVYEIGTSVKLFKNKLSLDFTYFNKLEYNFPTNAPIPSVSGFNSRQANIDETWVQRGYEISVGYTPVRATNFDWNIALNLSKAHWYYDKLDSVYTAKRPWIKKGARYDAYTTYDWLRDPQGNIIHQSGYPVQSNYLSKIGYSDPDWEWGISQTFRYKQFRLGVSIDGRIGGLAYSWTNQAMWNSGTHPESDNSWRYDEVVSKKTNYIANGVKVVSGSAVYDANGIIITDTRVFQPNDVPVSYEKYTMAYNGNAFNADPQNILDQTFAKLREVSLSYDLSPEWCKKVGMKALSVGVVGQNVLLWTKDFKYSDPDKGSEDLNAPSQRYLGFNFKLIL